MSFLTVSDPLGLRLMVWKVKHDFDADSFILDRNTVRGEVAICILKNCHTLGRHPYKSNPDQKRLRYSDMDTAYDIPYPLPSRQPLPLSPSIARRPPYLSQQHREGES